MEVDEINKYLILEILLFSYLLISLISPLT